MVKEKSAKPKLPPVKVIRAIDALRNGLLKLSQNLVPPSVALLDKVSGMWIAQAVGTVAKLGVADHFAAEGSTAVEHLAAQTGTHAESLYRVLRALSVVGVMREREGRRFELTAVGRCLRTDHPQSMRFMAIFQTELNWQHWARLDHCLRTGTNAVEPVRGQKPFDYLSQNPRDAEIFDRAMVNVSALEMDSILAAYDFGRFATIADVGGGYGAFLASILHVYTEVRGVLFDMPHVVKGAAEFLAGKGLSSRVRIEGGSFFEGVPEGADAYVMKHIIHDWSDELSLRILRNLRARMAPTARLLLVEAVVPEPNVADFSKFLDLEMLVVTEGGRERTRQEFRALLEAAGFELERIVPTASMAQVIEARPR